MRKIFLTLALLVIGIVAPILACSDNSARMTIDSKTRVACFAMPKQEPSKIDADLLQNPWSENKNLSDRDINDIMNKR